MHFVICQIVQRKNRFTISLVNIIIIFVIIIAVLVLVSVIGAGAVVTRDITQPGTYVGVPVIIGAGGAEKVIEIQLSGAEQKAFDKSVGAVAGLIDACKKIAPKLA